MISRQNIISFLEEGGSRYHSCIITSYSFDFTYFEHRILPKLRSKGIMNVNLFIDAKMLESALTEVNYFNTTAQKTYSLNRVAMDGAFHPKIILAIGKKEGFLAVGSGNLTSSGISSNDEIWSAFHIDEKDLSNAYIFQRVYEFINPFIEGCYGKSQEKFTWILDNSDWFKKLINEKEIEFEDRRSDEVYLPLFSSDKNSIFESLKSEIQEEVETIEVLSPFYNQDGSLIQHFNDSFKPKRFQCIVDPQNGTLPIKFDNNNGVKFLSWDAIEFTQRKSNNRLHAKAFQFKSKDKTYFLCGSANATSEAFSINNKQRRNAEAAILIKHNGDKDFFKELGIIIPSTGSESLPIQENQIGTNDYLTSERKELQLRYCELDGNELLLIIAGETKAGSVSASLETSQGDVIAEKSIEHVSEKVRLELEDIESHVIFKVVLKRGSDIISNYNLVHHTAHLDKSNPDERLSKLLTIINQQDYGDAELEGLIEFIQTDDSTSKVKIRRKSDNKDVVKTEEESSDAITEEEYDAAARQYTSSSSKYSKQNYVVEDALYHALLKKYRSEDDVTESGESAAKQSGDTGSDDDLEVKMYRRTLPNYDVGISLKRSVDRILKKISDVLYKENKEITENRIEGKEANLFDQLYLALIGCHIILFKLTDRFEERRHAFTILRRSRKPLDVSEDDVRKGKGPIIETKEKDRALYVLERDFSLVKSKDQGEDIHQLTYSVGANKASKFAAKFGYNLFSGEGETELKNANAYFKLIGMDKTPSLKILHSYIDNLNFDKAVPYKKLDGAQKFALYGIGSYLKFKLLFSSDFEGKQQRKWIQFNERLFYRSLLLLMCFNFEKQLKHIHQVMLLNIFYILGNKDLTQEELGSKLKVRIEQLKLETSIVGGGLDYVIGLYSKYLKWEQSYMKDPNLVKQELAKGLLKQIVFSKSLGFGYVKAIIDKSVDLETPLGIEQEKKGFIGYSRQFIGIKPACFQK